MAMNPNLPLCGYGDDNDRRWKSMKIVEHENKTYEIQTNENQLKVNANQLKCRSLILINPTSRLG